RRFDARRRSRPAGCRIEERELVRAKAEHGDAEGLEDLRGRGHVQQGLGTRRYDERLAPRELAEIRGHVRTLLPAAMDTTDSAGPHELDADLAANGERSCDRRCADGALRDAHGEVAGSDLARVCVEPFEL